MVGIREDVSLDRGGNQLTASPFPNSLLDSGEHSVEVLANNSIARSRSELVEELAVANVPELAVVLADDRELGSENDGPRNRARKD